MRTGRKRLVASALTVMLLFGAARTAHAEEGGHYLEDLGWGLAAVGLNLVYMPAKLVYAVFGAIVGGLAYGVSGGNPEAAQLVWSPSLGGAYVLTPNMVRGHEPVFFSGEQYDVGPKREEDRPIRDEPIGEN